jgi:hypothetical protein
MWLNTDGMMILENIKLKRGKIYHIFVHKGRIKISSSSSICHGVGPLVDPFRSHVSRSLFKGLSWFLLPVGE